MEIPEGYGGKIFIRPIYTNRRKVTQHYVSNISGEKISGTSASYVTTEEFGNWDFNHEIVYGGY
ncbi:MAG: hypothetical protein ACQESP_11645 [Candidatus Muiribacteriota bacterium]